MGWRATSLPDLSGRVAVITGANSGIGLRTARALAAHGCVVTLACRDLDAARSAAGRFPEPGTVEVAELDLASMASVRDFAQGWKGPLDLLVNNAGIMAPPRPRSTADGFELQFGVNHLGHFVLTGMLLPALAEASGSRVVTVSSIAHLSGTASVVDANAAGPYDPRRTYANSKLANVVFAVALQERLREHRLPVTSTAAHPGVSATGLLGSRQGMGVKPMVRMAAPLVMRTIGQSAEAGARSVLYAAVEAEPGSYTGPQWLGGTPGPIGPARTSSLARDPDLARRLWRTSEELTGFHYSWDL